MSTFPVNTIVRDKQWGHLLTVEQTDAIGATLRYLHTGATVLVGADSLTRQFEEVK